MSYPPQGSFPCPQSLLQSRSSSGSDSSRGTECSLVKHHQDEGLTHAVHARYNGGLAMDENTRIIIVL